MAWRLRSRRAWGPGLLLVLGLATLAYAQTSGGGAGRTKDAPPPPTMEYTQQEVQANALVETLNELGKQHWEVFQVMPIFKVLDQGAGAELSPARYQILGRRPLAETK